MPTKRHRNVPPNPPKTVSTLKNWLGANWFNIISSLGVIIALALAVRANELIHETNELTRINSASDMSIVSEVFSRNTVMITGCQSENARSRLEFYIVDEFTIANNGGRTSALVDVDLRRGQEDYFITIYPQQSKDLANGPEPNLNPHQGIVFTDGLRTSIIVPIDGAELDLPLNIESGTAVRWTLQGEYIQRLEIEEVSDHIENFQEGPDILLWLFLFSDGSSITVEKNIQSYSVDEDIDSVTCET